MKRVFKRAAHLIAFSFLCAMLACALAGCSSSHSAGTPTKSSSAAAATHSTTQPYAYQQKNYAPPKPTYQDSRWPTTHPDLLAIPEYERWYNAWDSAETTCTIAGPVVKVYQAKDSIDMPIFIDIGAAYPSDQSVSLVIWAYQYDEFAELINAVDDGHAWLSVTGYLSIYDGRLQFNAGQGYVEYTWWTNVS